MTKRPEFVLASYVTYKELYDSKKYRSPYQILSEFVKYIICNKRLYFFSVSEMNKHMTDTFGFDVPYAVMKSTLKKTEGIINNGNDNYTVEQTSIVWNQDFEEFKNSAEQQSNTLIENLIAFTESRIGLALSPGEKKKLTECFMAYLLDDSYGGDYQESISTFILSSEQNETFKAQLQDIREGCILYTGIVYGINEFGSITEPLTLFLDTEVIFNIFGYNGEVYKTLAQEMLELIREANHPNKVIELKYFTDTKQEILDFFRKAEDIVDRKDVLKNNVAMGEIVNGCSAISDVIDKETDFFHKLKYAYGIIEDTTSDYYAEKFHELNLEEYLPDDPDLQKSLKFISHINKLRGTNKASDYLKAKYILITETSRTIEKARSIAKEQEELLGYPYANHAIHMSTITNLLWFKMNKGFGSRKFPTSIDAVVKARLVLSGYISQKIGYTYEKYKVDFENNEISEEEFVARLISLKNKKVKPEDLLFDTVEDDLNFSEEHLRKYEEEHNMQKIQLKERDEALAEKDIELAAQQKELLNQKETIDLQAQELEAYRKKDAEEQETAARKRKRNKLIKAIFVRLIIVAGIIGVSILLAKKIDEGNDNIIVTTITIISFVLAVIDFCKKGFVSDFKSLIGQVKK